MGNFWKLSAQASERIVRVCQMNETQRDMERRNCQGAVKYR